MKTQGAWAKAILKCIDQNVEAVPPGWLTVEGVAAELGLAVSTTSCRVRWLLDKKLIEKKQFKVRTGKMIRNVPHYKLKADV